MEAFVNITSKTWAAIGTIVAILALGWGVFTYLNDSAPDISATDDAQVQTGDGVQVDTGDNSTVTIGTGQ